jgi:hypothetical protein
LSQIRRHLIYSTYSSLQRELKSSEEFLVNQKMKQCLLDANINPYSIEGRADIYCRFILEYPDKIKVKKGVKMIINDPVSGIARGLRRG